MAFELSPASGGGWNESTIYAFQGSSDGAFPGFGLVLAGGDLYGATGLGGVGYGTIFELRPGSNGTWTAQYFVQFYREAKTALIPSARSPLTDPGTSTAAPAAM